MNVQKAFDEGFDLIKAYVDREMGVFDKQITELSRENLALREAYSRVAAKAVIKADEIAQMIAAEVQKAVSAIPVPKDGEDGKSVTVDEVAPLIAAEVQRAVSAIPVPKDGEDGKSVTVDDVAPLITVEVQKAVSAIPVPKDGEDGKSVTVDEVAPLIVAEVQKAVSLMPAPKDGEDGKSGLGLKEALIDAEGELVLTFDDGTIKRPGRVKGDAGRNGFELKDFDAALSEDGRTVTLSFDGGDIRHEVELAIPAAIYRGVYREGNSYVRGDMATFGGSIWHCAAEKTTEKPGDSSGDWVLAVKKGRDGAPGKDGDRGDPGRNGRDHPLLGSEYPG